MSAKQRVRRRPSTGRRAGVASIVIESVFAECLLNQIDNIGRVAGQGVLVIDDESNRPNV